MKINLVKKKVHMNARKATISVVAVNYGIGRVGKGQMQMERVAAQRDVIHNAVAIDFIVLVRNVVVAHVRKAHCRMVNVHTNDLPVSRY